MYTIKKQLRDTHSITRTRTLRQACKSIMDDTANPEITQYQIADKQTTSLLLKAGKEFHVFWIVGEKSRLISAQKEINSAMMAAGGIRAVQNPTFMAVA